MRTRRPYVQIDPDELERIRQIDLLTYLRKFEPSNVEEVKGTTNVYRTKTLKGLLGNDYEIVDDPPPIGKDFNDFLLSYLGISRQNNARERRDAR